MAADAGSGTQQIVLERNPDYKNFRDDEQNKGAPYLDGLQWRFIPEAATRLAALQSGELDVSDVDVQLVPELKSDLEGLHRTLAAVERVMNSADTTLLGADAPAQQELRAALQEFTRAAQSVRALTDYLERHPESALRGKGGPTRGAN